MKRWAAAGVRFALTWDELSPLLGVDPQDMVGVIRAVGPATLRAYGLTSPEMRQLVASSAKEMLSLAA